MGLPLGGWVDCHCHAPLRVAAAGEGLALTAGLPAGAALGDGAAGLGEGKALGDAAGLVEGEALVAGATDGAGLRLGDGEALAEAASAGGGLAAPGTLVGGAAGFAGPAGVQPTRSPATTTTRAGARSTRRMPRSVGGGSAWAIGKNPDRRKRTPSTPEACTPARP